MKLLKKKKKKQKKSRFCNTGLEYIISCTYSSPTSPLHTHGFIYHSFSKNHQKLGGDYKNKQIRVLKLNHILESIMKFYV